LLISYDPHMRILRECAAADLPAMRAIYNDIVRLSDAVFTESERSPQEFEDWWRTRVRADLPVVVAVEDGEIVGYASYGPFRPWPGYRRTVEHSVYVRADRRRAGHGQALLAELVRRARDAGSHVMVAGVDGANSASLALHEAHGFRHAGRLHEVAVKHGRWLDLVFLELALEVA
jgi:L-amino acid N-acyltransferase